MQVGVRYETRIKEKSEELGISFHRLLRGFVLEELMKLIYQSDFGKVMWLCNSQALGLEAYRAGKETVLEFYYIENKEKASESGFTPGAKLDWKLASIMIAMIFSKENSKEINWKGRTVQEKDYFQWNLMADFMNMEIPVSVRIFPYSGKDKEPELRSLSFFMNEGETLTYNHYSAESLLAHSFVEIMEMLELINSMEAYDIVDQILSSQAITGRHLMERLEAVLEEKPAICKKKRLEQLQSYKDYTYMRKRWESYCKGRGRSVKDWNAVMEMLLVFADPVWNAVCDHEIFLEDWMPELGRFLM